MDKKALAAALDYIPRWVAHQMRLAEQPGCALAIAHQGRLVAEWAMGSAGDGHALTPRHRFRVASHSKTFTAAAVLKLREQGRCRLDDPAGTHVRGLPPDVAGLTLAQLLSHSAGLVRDGADGGQWQDRRPFLDEADLRADLATAVVLPANARFKYSNHGYGLLGLVVAAITGEPYVDWVAREIVAPSGLKETAPDAPLPSSVPFARGHSAKWPMGERVVVPGANPTRALASATGFCSTAADLARFFASLDPASRRSVLSADSRRLMVQRLWRDEHNSLGRWYGLGTISGTLADWDWFGHTGSFQGTITRTVCVPEQGLCISALSNAADGASHAWVDGALHILRACAQHGAPPERHAAWQGRWWSLWGPVDLLPMGDKVLVANPSLPNPLLDAPQITPGDAAGEGRITLAGGFSSHGEPARLTLDAEGRATAFWLGGTRLQSEALAAEELRARYAV